MIIIPVGGIEPNNQTMAVFGKELDYPFYFVQLISWARIIGPITILIPGLKTIKEWAYAGLFFNLSGVIISRVAVTGQFDQMMLTLLCWIVPSILSYYYWKKKNNRYVF
ncbi:MAG TPA: DoxX family protein [Niabella sp.]|nr:DoxX family protein [Niabella sp.]